MSKDQNSSDKACDAYFDNPCAATSGSYYSDRVTFYAGFAAGAASRDAEVVSLTNQRDYEYVRAENAEQERDQLREQVNDLRGALKESYPWERHFQEKCDCQFCQVLAATETKP